MEVEKELREVKRRLDLAEAKLAQQSGQFEFITGQLRDVQLYLHARFSDIEVKIDGIEDKIAVMDGKIDGLEGNVEAIHGTIKTMDSKIDALPRALAEMLIERGQ